LRKQTPEKTEGANKNWQSIETGNIGNTRHKTKTNKTKTPTQHCWTPLLANNTNNVNKTWALLQKTGGKANQTSFSCGNRSGHGNTDLRV